MEGRIPRQGQTLSKGWGQGNTAGPRCDVSSSKTGWGQKTREYESLLGWNTALCGGRSSDEREHLRTSPSTPVSYNRRCYARIVSRTGSSILYWVRQALSLSCPPFTFCPFQKLLAQLWSQSPGKVYSRSQQLHGWWPRSPDDKYHCSKDRDIKMGQPKGNQCGTEESVARIGSMRELFGECGWFHPTRACW